MKINKSNKYKYELQVILSFIAKDKIGAMKNFRVDLNKSLQQLKDNPHRCRKSYYFDNKDIRDITFKGYTVIYKIFETRIEVMSIFNQNKP